jgi:hypothetical protein
MTVLLPQRPDPSHKAKHMALLGLTYLAADGSGSDVDNITHLRKLDAAEFLLSMDNGPWGTDKIVHHCHYGCCRNKKETRVKLWVAVQAPAFVYHLLMINDAIFLYNCELIDHIADAQHMPGESRVMLAIVTPTLALVIVIVIVIVIVFLVVPM